MNETINILIPYGYDDITEKDIRNGKDYVLRRERAAQALSAVVEELLKDATREITSLCYQYNVDPKNFQISERYNKELFDLISAILDELEDAIIEQVTEYSLQCTDDEEQKDSLLPWILLLGRDNRNLTQTLEARLWQFSRDLEAMITATRLSGLNQTTAITRIITNLHSVYTMPEVRAAFAYAANVKATYIRSRGVKYGYVGNSNSEANNINRFARMTLQMTWMRSQLMTFKKIGAAGFVQLRGSNYPCAICDEAAHFYDNIDEIMTKPYPHFHCMCYRVPVFKKQ